MNTRIDCVLLLWHQPHDWNPLPLLPMSPFNTLEHHSERHNKCFKFHNILKCTLMTQNIISHAQSLPIMLLLTKFLQHLILQCFYHGSSFWHVSKRPYAKKCLFDPFSSTLLETYSYFTICFSSQRHHYYDSCFCQFRLLSSCFEMLIFELNY